MSLNEIQPSKHPNLDCIGASIYTVLKYLNFSALETAWKQCGAIYLKTENAPYGDLNGQYMRTVAELHWIHNVRVEGRAEPEDDLFLAHIQERLEREVPTIVLCNMAELPYNPYYQDLPEMHSIIVTGREGNQLLIVDDYYRYKGLLPIEQFLQASNSSYRDAGTGEWYPLHNRSFELVLSESLHPTPDQLLEAVRSNLSVLEGRLEISQIKQDLDVPDDVNVEVGLKSLDPFLKDVEAFLASGVEITDDHLDILNHSLISMAQTRAMYANVLHAISEKYENFADLAEAYHSIGHQWKITTNMILKAFDSNRSDMVHRVLQKISSIKTQEFEAVVKTRELLERVGVVV
ncbi:BtrH N-terminal domain-containing protein [Brevibacillus fortis]|uniref:Butirosin biosynthesis protein H N-terminal domain-containing protein n=1 Tax=Brevibacillus fortis TaxID=2126352 RepID=A0A2P7UW50_9BACL|nr:BtrH N-terminal domain-containing protein [Brevibacillus fortis]MED1784015.1 BtrH N-terminal domain-containing protein [Brevibacillus fortis]PSJ91210.1 hypothetical protein C7R93_21465 [Brevibacillus fortis]